MSLAQAKELQMSLRRPHSSHEYRQLVRNHATWIQMSADASPRGRNRPTNRNDGSDALLQLDLLTDLVILRHILSPLIAMLLSKHR